MRGVTFVTHPVASMVAAVARPVAGCFQASAVDMAKAAAIAAGVPFPVNYVLPYSLVERSTVGKTAWDFTWRRGFAPFKAGDFESWKEKMGRADQPVFAVSTSMGRFDGWMLDRAAAQALCDAMNVRHFNVAAMSENKLKPVLL